MSKLYKELVQGLKEAIQHTQEKLTLKTEPIDLSDPQKDSNAKATKSIETQRCKGAKKDFKISLRLCTFAFQYS